MDWIALLLTAGTFVLVVAGLWLEDRRRCGSVRTLVENACRELNEVILGALQLAGRIEIPRLEMLIGSPLFRHRLLRETERDAFLRMKECVRKLSDMIIQVKIANLCHANADMRNEVEGYMQTIERLALRLGIDWKATLPPLDEP